MTPTTAKKIKALGLDPNNFSTEGVNLEGRTVLADPKTFGKTKELCLFKATGGFGCHPELRGTCVYVERLFDGMKGRIERYDVIAVQNEPAKEAASEPAKVEEVAK
jgi:hypothetical protein